MGTEWRGVDIRSGLACGPEGHGHQRRFYRSGVDHQQRRHSSKVTPSGVPVWIGATAFDLGITLKESGFDYTLSDLHAADNGSVIVSFVRNHGFGSNNYLYANKLSSTGQLMWGSNMPMSMTADRCSSANSRTSPMTEMAALSSPGTPTARRCRPIAAHPDRRHEAFGHNGSLGSTNSKDVQVEPSSSYNPLNGSCSLLGTESDQLQDQSGVSGQRIQCRRSAWSGAIAVSPLFL